MTLTPYQLARHDIVAMVAARLAVAVLLIALAPEAGLAEDSCGALLPDDLANAAVAAYPGYRPPRVSDNLEEDVTTWRAAGASPCLGLAQGDVYGDRRPAYVLGMSGPGQSWLVAAARQIGGHWRFEQIETFPAGRNRLFVAIGAPGVYRAGGSESDGSEKQLVCRHSVVLTGATEAGETAYCRDAKGWHAVPLSD